MSPNPNDLVYYKIKIKKLLDGITNFGHKSSL